MTKIKICGLMRLEDIAYVNAYRPDYGGFIFAKSRRQVDGEWVKGLRSFLDPEIAVTGVFVNEPIDNVAKLCENKTIDVVQLHGDEDMEYMETLKKKISNPVVKALRVKDGSEIVQAEMFPCDYLLLDTYVSNQYGGSGECFDLKLISSVKKPFFLAGGLTVENVSDKVNRIHPFGVDVSSGVEGDDGWKDRNKIRTFIENVRRGQ